MIWGVYMGTNRLQCLKFMGYNSVDCIECKGHRTNRTRFTFERQGSHGNNQMQFEFPSAAWGVSLVDITATGVTR